MARLKLQKEEYEEAEENLNEALQVDHQVSGNSILYGIVGYPRRK